MFASGHASSNGTQAPWSRPRVVSRLVANPDCPSIVAICSARASSPGAG